MSAQLPPRPAGTGGLNGTSSGWHGVVDAVLEPSRIARDLRELTKAHREALVEHRREMRRHRRAVRFRTRRSDPIPTPEGPRVPPPPQRLRLGAPGAAEVSRLIRAQRQMLTLVPQVERLHAGAAIELRRAQSAAAPVLLAQVERLAALDDVMRRVRNTDAAHTARQSADAILLRLRTGVAAYERLVQAGITMLAAPDLTHDAGEVLSPAVLGLTSYAHGLHHSAKALGRQEG
ncbi:MAG: hypothetical protein WCJ42_07245 [Actinomycetes bacterium]